MPTAQTPTVTVLQQASAGLLYQSESDAPWTVVSWPTASGEVTGVAVRKLGKHKARDSISEKSVDKLFTPLTEDKDWYGDEEKAIAQRYQVLLATINGTLTNPKVIRIGKVEVAVYIIGLSKEGGLAGMKTMATET